MRAKTGVRVGLVLLIKSETMVTPRGLEWTEISDFGS